MSHYSDRFHLGHEIKIRSSWLGFRAEITEPDQKTIHYGPRWCDQRARALEDAKVFIEKLSRGEFKKPKQQEDLF